jgi:hypothetical protein
VETEVEAEVETEVETEVIPEEEAEVETPQGLLASFTNFMRGRADGGAPNAVAALDAQNARLIAEVETLSADLDAVAFERDGLRARVGTLEADAKSVVAMIAECGFSHAGAEALPGPVDDTPDASGGVSILEEFEAMSAGVVRSEFYRENKAEILRAYDSRGGASR